MEEYNLDLNSQLQFDDLDKFRSNHFILEMLILA